MWVVCLVIISIVVYDAIEAGALSSGAVFAGYLTALLFILIPLTTTHGAIIALSDLSGSGVAFFGQRHSGFMPKCKFISGEAIKF